MAEAATGRHSRATATSMFGFPKMGREKDRWFAQRFCFFIAQRRDVASGIFR
jgi:hypothetical protein